MNKLNSDVRNTSNRMVTECTRRVWPRFRYSLRTLLGSFTVLLLLLGYTVNESRRQKEIVDELCRQGGVPKYSSDKPSWLPEAFDLWRIGRIEEVSFADEPATNIQIVRNLTNLKALWLAHSRVPIEELSVLQDLPQLAQLELHDTRLSPNDLAQLRNMLPNCMVRGW
jgi:hypothetical protein